MSYNIRNIKTDTAENGGILVYWLGGAGFAFKFATGDIICIDPYLSDSCEDIVGFKRLTIPPIEARDLHFDHILFTHDHLDHLDPHSYDDLAAANPGCGILASESCAEYLREKKAKFTVAEYGLIYQAGNVQVKVIKADHGDGCATAVGFLLTWKDRSIYFTGDTALTMEDISPAVDTNPEILIPCINGAFGNLSEVEAAELAHRCKASIAIPSHFWLLAEHGGDPMKFIKAVESQSPETKVVLLKAGRGEEI